MSNLDTGSSRACRPSSDSLSGLDVFYPLFQLPLRRRTVVDADADGRGLRRDGDPPHHRHRAGCTRHLLDYAPAYLLDRPEQLLENPPGERRRRRVIQDIQFVLGRADERHPSARPYSQSTTPTLAILPTQSRLVSSSSSPLLNLHGISVILRSGARPASPRFADQGEPRSSSRSTACSRRPRWASISCSSSARDAPCAHPTRQRRSFPEAWCPTPR